MSKDSFTYFDALVEVFSRDSDDDEEVQSKSVKETEEEREMRLSGMLVLTEELERKEGIYRDKNGNISQDIYDKISRDNDDRIARRRQLRWLSKRPMRESESDDVLTSMMMNEKKRKVEKYQEREYFDEDESADENSDFDKECCEFVKKARKNGGVSLIQISRKNVDGARRRTSRKNDGASTSRTSRKNDGASTSRPTKKNKGLVPDPAPPLPDDVRAKMEENGPLDGEPILVVQRILTETDLKDNNNRLQIPLNQVLNKNFLSIREYKHLRTLQIDEKTGKNKSTRKFISAGIIMPSLTEGRITVKIWDMTKSGSKTICEMFAFNGGWKELVAHEKDVMNLELVVGMVLQVWAYRVNSSINFALVNLGAFSRDYLGNIFQVQIPANNDARDQLPVNVAENHLPVNVAQDQLSLNVVQAQHTIYVDAPPQLPEHNNNLSEEYDSLEEHNYLEEDDFFEDDFSEEDD